MGRKSLGHRVGWGREVSSLTQVRGHQREHMVLRGSMVSNPPLFITGGCVSPEAQGEVFPEGNLSIGDMLV